MDCVISIVRGRVDVFMSPYLTSTAISILPTETFPLFIFVLVVCLCLVGHNSQLTGPFLSPSSLLHLSPPSLLFPGPRPALTPPPCTRPCPLLPLPFLIRLPRWLPRPHPRLRPRPSSGRGLPGPSPVRSVFPTSSCGGAPTVTGTGR